MALDFTVVFSVRQRFGDSQDEELLLETEAPFVGREKDYAFQCPGVDARQSALLVFQSQGVSVVQRMELNGQQIFGGIPTSIDFGPIVPNAPQRTFVLAQWKGNIMLVHPGVLREDNVLRISAGSVGGDNVDNFVLDNMVVLFKVRKGPFDPGGGVVVG